MARLTSDQINAQKATSKGDKKAAILFGRHIVEEDIAANLKPGDKFKTVQGGSARSAYVVERKEGLDATLYQMGHTHEVQFESDDVPVFVSRGRR